ncbi:glycosyltransferase [Mucilaginibacter sp.]|uniref:glycosyltransferase n=1 Tax=Mucilaginibacter sp. TaxID=1882438 RepID=UPI00283CA108|nr:glycosyltransferase [Mucilaginibacter sp.]MDR3695463.1 glycosyltransferase [Mucilaginibacter sp.]
MSALVSIIIPIYNAEKNLAACLDSAINQTWKNTEIIMVDDGSSDSSLSVAQKYADGKKIILISQKNSGASVARNMGLKVAKGEYIQFLDADDLLNPEKIESQVNVLENSVNQVALCRTIHFFDGDDPTKSEVTDDWFCADNNNPVDFLLKLYAGEDEMPGFGGMIQPNAWLTPRVTIEKAGPWNEFRGPDDDGEFFCRVVLASEGIKFSGKGVNYYRKYKSAASLSGQKSAEAFENIILSLNLKYGYLKEWTTDPILDRIFARHYWWTGVAAYPRFKELSGNCIQKATELGYKGKKYMGGPAGHTLAGFLGWKPVRFMAYWQQRFKAVWA